MGNLYASNLYPTHQYFPYRIVAFILYIKIIFKMTNNDSKLKEDIHIRNLHLELNKN